MAHCGPTFEVTDDEFDKGNPTATLHSHLDVSKLAVKGKSATVQCSPDDLARVFGVADPDLVDFKDVTTTIYKNDYPYAISYSVAPYVDWHDTGKGIPTGLNIENHTLYRGNGIKMYAHAVGVPGETTTTGPHSIQDNRHILFNSDESERKVTADLTETIKKRCLRQYRGAKPSDVTIGIKKITHKPTQKVNHIVYKTGIDDKNNTRANLMYRVFHKQHMNNDLDEDVEAIDTGADIHFVCSDPDKYKEKVDFLTKATQAHTPIGKHGLIIKASLLKDKPASHDPDDEDILSVQSTFTRSHRWDAARGCYVFPSRENKRIQMVDVNKDAVAETAAEVVADKDPASALGFGGHNLSDLKVEDHTGFGASETLDNGSDDEEEDDY